jgi:hypothetical protein
MPGERSSFDIIPTVIGQLRKLRAHVVFNAHAATAVYLYNNANLCLRRPVCTLLHRTRRILLSINMTCAGLSLTIVNSSYIQTAIGEWWLQLA